MKKVVLFLLGVFVLTSCSTTKSGTSKSMDIIGSGVMHRPVIADLDVKDQKISSTMNFSSVESMANARNEVIRKALKDNNADVLIEPSFEATSTSGKTDLTVRGWPANYKNFRPVEENDIKFLELNPNYLQKAETKETVVEEKSKGKGLWITLAAILVGTIALAATL